MQQEVRIELRRFSMRKAVGLDVSADELTELITKLFDLSLLIALVPTCFKTFTIIPVPKESASRCLNNYCPVARTPIVRTCWYREQTVPKRTRSHNALTHLEEPLTTTLQGGRTHLLHRDP